MSPRLLLVGTLALLSVAAVSTPLSTASTSGPAATTSANGCASEHNSQGVKLWIHVTKWCIVPGVRKQAQLKVQMRIHNQSNRPLDISRDRIRVILREFDPDRWSPPRIGQPTRERPIRTTYRGESVWAVPANADSAYDMFPNKNAPTHATHWVKSQLGPKETLNPHMHYGDLVYHLPIPQPKPRGWKAIHNVVGIAYTKGRDIIAICPPRTWGEHAEAGTFAGMEFLR
ncbi:MAG TPA: hypothetical protein VGV69_10475 [Solirubrobacterales bacterium]|nr:hypothetical protein [Solirubrobacterales bacterium]